MKDVRNANEFLNRLRTIRNRYDEHFGPRIKKLRESLESAALGELEGSLEAHIRAYFVNGFLEALNWRIDQGIENDLPALIPEAPVRSETKDSIRYLDYLGLERATAKPLLIVETKRPSADLPRILQTTASYAEIISRGLSGERLTGDWNKWLSTLADYSNSVTTTNLAPRRVAITNGNWLILFLDPTDAFSKDGNHNPEGILVYEDFNAMDKRFLELFHNLEYFKVSQEIEEFSVGDLLFNFEKQEITELMHGLRLRFSNNDGIYHRSPSICVAPILFFRTRTGAWYRVETLKQFELPHENVALPKHLDDVERQAKLLLNDVRRLLDSTIVPKTLEAHYEEDLSFSQLKGITEISKDQYLVVTGENSHYLCSRPSILDCPYHEWSAATKDGCATPAGPILVRSVAPRSFFLSGEIHHCAHRDVNTAKSAQITTANNERLGARSGNIGQAFCEIWSFDEHLCCRTCAFEKVCAKSAAFKLPCKLINVEMQDSL